MFKKIRVAILLYVLLIVALTSWSARERNTDWETPLWVVIYPIAGDKDNVIEKYVASLNAAEFEQIEVMMRREAARYGVKLTQPVDVRLAPVVSEIPPSPPTHGNPLQIAYWSLKLRWWARNHDTFDGPADIRIFALFFNPEKHERLAHSLGLQKGFLGVVNGFGDKKYAGRNNVVITHELLHTLGATDKYDLATNQARIPDGIADPAREPLYPQLQAEIMAGRIPLTQETSKMPRTLQETVIGPMTALEIGWRR